MSSRRFRRSKIYDLNYNIGENYYRSAVDRLDESSRSRPSLSRFSEPPPETVPVEKKTLIQEIDDELLLSRERAHKVIQKPTVLDRPAKKLELETDFDEQVKKSLERIAISKKLLKSIDLEDTWSSSADKKSSKAHVIETVASARAQSLAAQSDAYKSRTVKVTSDVESSAAQSRKELAKWSNDTDYYDSQSFAKVRARQSARQLADIEQEMTQVSERQQQREQRMSNVRKLLAENSVEYLPPTPKATAAISNGVASLKITKTTSTSKKVSTY